VDVPERGEGGEGERAKEEGKVGDSVIERKIER
jgi:hypothetical protein